MELRGLTCKQCGAPLKGTDLRLDFSIARCSHCGTIFSLHGMPSVKPAENSSSESTERMPVPMPEKFVVSDGGVGNGFQIAYRWIKPSHTFLLAFAVFWNLFMLFWHGMSLLSGAWFMSVFGLLHTAVGIILLYGALTGLLNTTTITVAQGMVTIQHRPLPWPGEKQFLAQDIEQLYCREQMTHGRHGSTYRTYEVRVILRDSTAKSLVSSLQSPEQALYVEQEIERHLRIQDRPVRGELPR